MDRLARTWIWSAVAAAQALLATPVFGGGPGTAGGLALLDVPSARAAAVATALTPIAATSLAPLSIPRVFPLSRIPRRPSFMRKASRMMPPDGFCWVLETDNAD